jgi:hypothetical protein
MATMQHIETSGYKYFWHGELFWPPKLGILMKFEKNPGKDLVSVKYYAFLGL